MSKALTTQNIRTTKLASTGGFLRSGNTTFLIGVEDSKVQQVLDIIRDKCSAREQQVSSVLPLGGSTDA